MVKTKKTDLFPSNDVQTDKEVKTSKKKLENMALNGLMSNNLRMNNIQPQQTIQQADYYKNTLQEKYQQILSIVNNPRSSFEVKYNLFVNGMNSLYDEITDTISRNPGNAMDIQNEFQQFKQILLSTPGITQLLNTNNVLNNIEDKIDTAPKTKIYNAQELAQNRNIQQGDDLIKSQKKLTNTIKNSYLGSLPPGSLAPGTSPGGISPGGVTPAATIAPWSSDDDDDDGNKPILPYGATAQQQQDFNNQIKTATEIRAIKKEHNLHNKLLSVKDRMNELTTSQDAETFRKQLKYLIDEKNVMINNNKKVYENQVKPRKVNNEMDDKIIPELIRENQKYVAANEQEKEKLEQQEKEKAALEAARHVHEGNKDPLIVHDVPTKEEADAAIKATNKTGGILSRIKRKVQSAFVSSEYDTTPDDDTPDDNENSTSEYTEDYVYNTSDDDSNYKSVNSNDDNDAPQQANTTTNTTTVNNNVVSNTVLNPTINLNVQANINTLANFVDNDLNAAAPTPENKAIAEATNLEAAEIDEKTEPKEEPQPAMYPEAAASSTPQPQPTATLVKPGRTTLKGQQKYYTKKDVDDQLKDKGYKENTINTIKNQLNDYAKLYFNNEGNTNKATNILEKLKNKNIAPDLGTREKGAGGILTGRGANSKFLLKNLVAVALKYDKKPNAEHRKELKDAAQAVVNEIEKNKGIWYTMTQNLLNGEYSVKFLYILNYLDVKIFGESENTWHKLANDVITFLGIIHMIVMVAVSLAHSYDERPFLPDSIWFLNVFKEIKKMFSLGDDDDGVDFDTNVVRLITNGEEKEPEAEEPTESIARSRRTQTPTKRIKGKGLPVFARNIEGGDFHDFANGFGKVMNTIAGGNEQIHGGDFHDFANGFGKVMNTIAGGNGFFDLSDHYMARVQNELNKYGDLPISNISIVRTPIPGVLNSVFNRYTPYDQLFHLALRVKVSTGVDVYIEKLSYPSITTAFNINGSSESLEVPGPYPANIKVMLDKTRDRIGSRFWSYDSFNNNCQHFIKDILTTFNLYNPSVERFVMQNINTKAIPVPLQAVSKASTNLHNWMNRHILGGDEHGFIQEGFRN